MSAISKSTVNEIVKLHEQLGGLVRKSVETVWRLGQLLTQAKGALDFGDFIPWIEENLPFARTTAFRYMKVYSRWPQGLPEAMSLTEAYLESGVKRLTAPEPEEKIEPERPALIPARQFDTIFKSTPLSDVDLQNYRVIVNETGQVWSIRRGVRELFPMAQFFPRPEPEAQEAVARFRYLLQSATENYLADIEKLEAEGVLNPPRGESGPDRDKRAKAKLRVVS